MCHVDRRQVGISIRRVVNRLNHAVRTRGAFQFDATHRRMNPNGIPDAKPKVGAQHLPCVENSRAGSTATRLRPGHNPVRGRTAHLAPLQGSPPGGQPWALRLSPVGAAKNEGLLPKPIAGRARCPQRAVKDDNLSDFDGAVRTPRPTAARIRFGQHAPELRPGTRDFLPRDGRPEFRRFERAGWKRRAMGKGWCNSVKVVAVNVSSRHSIPARFRGVSEKV
jgi:hypothetical protein